MDYTKLICHRMPERSFFIRGYQFPVCARCTGFYISLIIYFIYTYFNFVNYNIPLLIFAVILLIPAMVVVLYDVIKVIRLSTVKQKVEESIKDIPENPEDKRKQEKLKQELKEKYKEKQVDDEEIPVMREENVKVTINNEEKEEIVEPLAEETYEEEKEIPVSTITKPKGLEGIDMNKILNNISNLTGEQIDVPKVLNNINNIEDNQDDDLPKLK